MKTLTLSWGSVSHLFPGPVNHLTYNQVTSLAALFYLNCSHCCSLMTFISKILLMNVCLFVRITSVGMCIHSSDDSEEAVTYRSLKAQHKKLEHDFITMTKIIGLLSTLTKNYQVRKCTWWGVGVRGWGPVLPGTENLVAKMSAYSEQPTQFHFTFLCLKNVCCREKRVVVVD